MQGYNPVLVAFAYLDLAKRRSIDNQRLGETTVTLQHPGMQSV